MKLIEVLMLLLVISIVTPILVDSFIMIEDYKNQTNVLKEKIYKYQENVVPKVREF